MKKILIIGGGIAGLTAGIYAQKAGFQSVIVEKHSITGGECTGWDRKGFHIDGCIHWLMGTKEGTGLNRLWKEVGALEEETEIHQPDYAVKAEYEGSTVYLYRDLDKLKEHLIDVSPEDREEIETLCQSIEAFIGFEPPVEKPLDMMNPIEIGKFMVSMRKVGSVRKQLGNLTVGDYCTRFKNPAIGKALTTMIPEYYSAYILPSSLATFVSGNGGRPKGGSRAFARRMEEKYKSLGGELVLGKEVKEIVVEGGRAKALLLEDGSEMTGDYVVPACDSHVTLKILLKDRYRDRKFEERYKDENTYPLQSSVYLSLGVDGDLTGYPQDFAFQTEKLQVEDEQTDMISYKHYCYEPAFAPVGKSIMIVYFPAKYQWWKEKKREQYMAEKTKLGEDVIKGVEGRFPELQGKIRVLDVATPLTYERYCGAYKGSWMSFGATPKAKQMIHKGRIKGIKNLYMAGQWLMPPGGLPSALLTGKWAIQRIK